MSYTNINAATPLGTDKGKVLDNEIRDLKAAVKANLNQISTYLTTDTQASTVAFKTAVWTTAGRPSGTSLQDRVEGYNTTLGYKEYYDLGTTTWKPCGHTDAAINALAQAIIDAIEPIGTVKMWSNSIATIPAGWHLCDGTNGTIDLRGRVPVGAGADGGTYTPGDDGVGTGYYAPGATGGVDKHTLTITEMPAHTHTLSAGDVSYNNGSGNTRWGTNTNASTGSTGGGGAHENRPPYYAIAFIQRIS